MREVTRPTDPGVFPKAVMREWIFRKRRAYRVESRTGKKLGSFETIDEGAMEIGR